jgi:hypothetical protein
MRGVVNERTTIIGSIRQTCKPSPRTHGRYPKRITHLRRALPSGIPGHSEGNTEALCGGEEMSESKPKELTKEKYEQRINDEFQQSINPKMGYSEWAKLKESYLKKRGE